MKDIDQFSRKTFTVEMKNKLFRSLRDDIVEVRDDKIRKFKIFIDGLLENKLLTEDEKYLRDKPFVRSSTYVKIRYGDFDISIKGSSEFEFHVSNPGIPHKINPGEKAGTPTDLTQRLIEKCSNPEINYIKDSLIELHQLKLKIKNFGVDTGIAPTWSYGNAFENVRTIGHLYKLNKDYYERLTQLYPEVFDEKLSIERKILDLKKLLGY